MTGTDVVVHQPQQVTVLSNEQLTYISRTEFVPSGLRGNLPAILACVATGRALGIADMTALRSIHIIDGKATFAAELMVLLVRRDGHSITGEVGDGTATVTGTRADNGDSMSSTWTLAMADRAGLLNKSNWKKYPEAMLWARAVSQLCRMLFADCFAGNTYTAEELDGTVMDESPSVADDGLFPPIDEYAEIEDSAGGPLPAEAESAPGVGRVLEPAESGEASGVGNEPKPGADKPSAAQLKKLNVLVGTLREAGRLTTEDVWRTAGHEPVVSDDGELHWSPLRDLLSKQEASALIESLTLVEAVPLSLTSSEFKLLVSERGIDDQAVSVVGRRMFPAAQSMRALSDRDRAAVWAELAREAVGV